MSVGITAWGRLHGPDLNTFKARRELPERKHLKLMTRPVRLGVAAIGRAIEARGGLEAYPPERRGLFVGAVPRGAAEDLGPALEVARSGADLDLVRFGTEGLARLHPLWLVKGLSNNIPGYACAYWDLRGSTANRCEGAVGGLAAIVQAVRALEAGEVDVAIAGGADVGLRWTAEGPEPAEEGAAFVVLERNRGRRIAGAQVLLCEASEPGKWPLGAATGVLALVHALDDPGARVVEVRDGAVGLMARVQIAARADGAGSGESPGGAGQPP